MVISAFSSGRTGGQSEDWNIDGYGGRNLDPSNYVNGPSASKNDKKGTYNAPTASAAIAGSLRDFQSGDVDSRFSAPNMKSSNIMHNKSNATTSKTSKTGHYGAPTAPSATAEYWNDFQSGEGNPSYTPNSTNTTINANYGKAGKDIFAVKDANDGKSKATTAARASSAYSNTCQSGDIDSSPTYNTNGLINTGKNGTSKANGINNSKNGKQSHSHESAAPPASAAYPSAFQSGQQVPSAFAPSNDTIHSKTYTKDTSSISKIKKGNIGNYHSSTTHPAAGSYSSALDPDYVDSTYAESTDAMYNTNTNSTSKNGKNVNNQSATTRPATATYSRASQSREINSRSIPSSSHTTNDANAASIVDIGNPMNYGMKNNYQSSTSRPTIVANSRALKPSDVHTNSGSSAQAWEEHIDVATNRSFYYNNITKRSTWGLPSGMVKKAPPPPPSPPPMTPIVHKREQDQWTMFNEVATVPSQAQQWNGLRSADEVSTIAFKEPLSQARAVRAILRTLSEAPRTT
eukprot:jgi/Undpi1/318/HiC_scaffold_1.g00314.m1